MVIFIFTYLRLHPVDKNSGSHMIKHLQRHTRGRGEGGKGQNQNKQIGGHQLMENLPLGRRPVVFSS